MDFLIPGGGSPSPVPEQPVVESPPLDLNYPGGVSPGGAGPGDGFDFVAFNAIPSGDTFVTFEFSFSLASADVFAAPGDGPPPVVIEEPAPPPADLDLSYPGGYAPGPFDSFSWASFSWEPGW